MVPAPTIQAVVGGESYDKVIANVIMASPGKLGELISKRKVDLSNVKVFVLDEADDMIVNFAPAVGTIHAKITSRKGITQVLLFSASFECLQTNNTNVVRARKFTDEMVELRKGRKLVSMLVEDVEGLKLANVTHFVAKVCTFFALVSLCCGGCNRCSFAAARVPKRGGCLLCQTKIPG
jgi:superfamily II DNA/RNA helicase